MSVNFGIFFMVSGGIAIPIISAALVIIGVEYLFYYYGTFRYDKFSAISISIYCCVPLIMVISLLPYDLAEILRDPTEVNNQGMKIIFSILYWVSFLCSWIFIRFGLAYKQYSNVDNFKRRIWMAIKHNLWFFAIAGGLLIVGLIILLATTKLSIYTLIGLASTLGNAAGLFLASIFLGYGLILLPRNIWEKSDPIQNICYGLYNLASLDDEKKKIFANAHVLIDCGSNARNHLNPANREKFERIGTPFINQLLEESIGTNVDYNNKKITKFYKSDFDWANISQNDFDLFLCLLEEVSIQYSGIVAQVNVEKEIASKNISFICKYSTERPIYKIKKYFSKALSVVVLMLNIMFYWCEFTLMFKPQYSVFYIIGQKCDIVSRTFFFSIAVGYLLFIAVYALIHFRIKGLLSIIKGATTINSISYSCSILGMFVPPIGYHFQKQVGASGSQLQRLMGDMDSFFYFGTIGNILTPIIILLVSLIVAFRVVDKILAFFKIDKFSFEKIELSRHKIELGMNIFSENSTQNKIQLDVVRDKILKFNGHQKSGSYEEFNDLPINDALL